MKFTHGLECKTTIQNFDWTESAVQEVKHTGMLRYVVHLQCSMRSNTEATEEHWAPFSANTLFRFQQIEAIKTLCSHDPFQSLMYRSPPPINYGTLFRHSVYFKNWLYHKLIKLSQKLHMFIPCGTEDYEFWYSSRQTSCEPCSLVPRPHWIRHRQVKIQSSLVLW
jgi:hypothetical protein